MTLVPSDELMCSASTRAKMSVDPPGGNGTTIVIGPITVRAGSAEQTEGISAATATTRLQRSLREDIGPLMGSSLK